mgnify:CR=1 FL=1
MFDFARSANLMPEGEARQSSEGEMKFVSVVYILFFTRPRTKTIDFIKLKIVRKRGLNFGSFGNFQCIPWQPKFVYYQKSDCFTKLVQVSVQASVFVEELAEEPQSIEDAANATTLN